MEFVQLLWSAVILACSYILLGVGMNLQFATLRVVNFAQGQIFMVGAMIVAVGAQRFGVWGSLVIAMVVCGVISVAVEKLTIGPVLRSDSQHSRIQTSLLATAAAGTIITAVAALLWGDNERPVPSLVGQHVYHVGIVITAQELEVLIGTIICLVGVWILLYKTRLGMDIRALRSDPYAASLYGIRRELVSSLVFFISGAIGGLTGVLISPTTSISPNTGIDYSIITLICVIIAGLGYVWRVVPVAIAFAIFWNVMETYVSSANGYYYALFGLLAAVVIVPVLQGKNQTIGRGTRRTWLRPRRAASAAPPPATDGQTAIVAKVASQP